MSGIGKSIGNIVGGITGANAASGAQVNAANQSNAAALQVYNDQKQRLQPFLDAGKSALPGLQAIAGQPIDRTSLLSGYLGSDEFSQLANQARYQTLASAEATGGLGSTATANGLAAIAPQLGQNYLNSMTDQQNNMYSQFMGLSNLGVNSASAANAAGNAYSNAAQNNYSAIGAAQAGNSLANGNTLTSGLGFLSGTSLGSKLGNGLTGLISGLF